SGSVVVVVLVELVLEVVVVAGPDTVKVASATGCSPVPSSHSAVTRISPGSASSGIVRVAERESSSEPVCAGGAGSAGSVVMRQLVVQSAKPVPVTTVSVPASPLVGVSVSARSSTGGSPSSSSGAAGNSSGSSSAVAAVMN